MVTFLVLFQHCATHYRKMVCYWLYAVIVYLKVTAFFHVSLVSAKVHPEGLYIKSLKLCGKLFRYNKICHANSISLVSNSLFHFTEISKNLPERITPNIGQENRQSRRCDVNDPEGGIGRNEIVTRVKAKCIRRK